MVTIVTGERGIGKTSFLLREITALRKIGSVGGILTPGNFGNQHEKTGFNALDVSTGSQWLLGSIDTNLKGPVFGPFSFSSEGFARAVASCTAALLRQDDFIFLDEIGPLELERDEGFAPVFPLLPQASGKSSLCIVVRPSLITQVVQRIFPKVPCRTIEVTQENRDDSRFRLFNRL